MSRLELRILALLACLCVALVWLDPWRDSEVKSDTRVLRGGELAQLTEVSFTGAGAEVHTQIQADGMWFVQGSGGVVSALAMRRVIDVLGLLRVVRTVPSSPSHGFGDGAAVVSLTSATGQTVALHLGAHITDGRRRWIRRDTRGPSLLVEAHLVDELLESVTKLSSGPLMPWAVGSPIRVESEQRWVEWQAPWLRWGEGEATREVVGSKLRVQAWLRALSSIRASADDENCVRPPALLVSSGDSSLDLSKFDCLTADILAEALAGWRAPETLADMYLFPTERPQHDFSIECGSERREIILAKADQAALWEWWGALRTAPLRLVPKQSGDRRCTVSGKGWSVALAGRGAVWRASSPHPGYDFALGPETKRSFVAISELFRERLLIAEDAVFLRSLTWQEGSHLKEWKRGEGSQEWTTNGEVLGRDTRLALERAATVLATLRVHSFGTERPVDVATAVLRASFLDPLSGAQRTYQLEQFGDVRECLVRVDEHPPAQLTSEDCNAIWLGRL